MRKLKVGILLSAISLVPAVFAEMPFGVYKDGGAYRVTTAGVEFRLSEGGFVEMVEGGVTNRLFGNAFVIMENGKSTPVAFDRAVNSVTVAEKTDRMIVLRTERILGKIETRMTFDYVFRRDVPGLLVLARAKAAKAFDLLSFHTVFLPKFARLSIDEGEWEVYPRSSQDFRKRKGGYNSLSTLYVKGESTDGSRWWLGREFHMFAPNGPGVPGQVYAPGDIYLTGKPRPIAPGTPITMSISAGRLRSDTDLAKLRALRTGNGELAVPPFGGDWDKVPQTLWRGETADYRPMAGLGWDGKRDLSFVLKLAQDKRGVRVFVDVTDDLVRNTFDGKGDVTLGDAVQIMFADATGKRTLVRTLSATKARRMPTGYLAEFVVGWDELKAAGIDRRRGVRLNVCVTDQDNGTDLENWMGVADGIRGGCNPALFPFMDFSMLQPTFEGERAALPSHAELQAMIDRVRTENRSIPRDGEDEYTQRMNVMTDYFLDFMQKDLYAKDADLPADPPRPNGMPYRHYLERRIQLNALALLDLQRELAKRQRDLAAGVIKPLKTIKYPKVRPVVADGGFKVNGRELLLMGPDTWPNVKGWHNDDIDWIGKMGFNLFNCFYIGGTNYQNVVRRCEELGLYCVWGSAAPSTTPFGYEEPADMSYTIERQNTCNRGVGTWLGSMIPTNPSPMFVFQVSFPEQWDRALESKESWAADFRTYLQGKFGSLAAMNAKLATNYADWKAVDFAAALGNDALKYESAVYRLERNSRYAEVSQRWFARRYGLPRSTHYSSYYNIGWLDPIVALADFERHWDMFDVVGFDGGFGIMGSEWAFDFPKGGFDYDLARSCYPMKPVANNENHVIEDGSYQEFPDGMTYLSNLLAFLMGQNASSVWDWSKNRHSEGEYAFTRANTCREMIRLALDLQRFPEEIAAFRRTPNPPWRIFHSYPSLADRDTYVKSLYPLYGALSFTGWATRFVTERQLARHELDGVKVVVVPDARRVSDETFAVFADFVEKGGIVLADGGEALSRNEWGRPVPARAKTLAKFRRFPGTSSRERFDALNAVLAEKRARFSDLQPSTFGIQPCFGVMWRTGLTAAGEKVAFVANLSKATATVRIPAHAGRPWVDILSDRTIAGDVTLRPCDVLLLK